MTNEIGTGTRNITVNAPTDEREFWGDLSAAMNVRSVGDLHRAMLLKGLEQIRPDKAKELKAIRQRYYGAALLVMLLAALASGAGREIRQAKVVRPIRTVRRVEMEMELAA